MKYFILLSIVIIINQCEFLSSKPKFSSSTIILSSSTTTTTTTSTITVNDSISLQINSTSDSDEINKLNATSIPIIRVKRKGTGGRAGGGRAGGGRAGVGAARGLAGRQGRTGSRNSYSTQIKSSHQLICLILFTSIGLLLILDHH